MYFPFVSSLADRFLERLVYAAMLSASVLRQEEEVGSFDIGEEWRAWSGDEARKVAIVPDGRGSAADFALAPAVVSAHPRSIGTTRKLAV